MEPFLNRDARELGLTPDRIRHSDFDHPAAGVSVLSAASATLAERCRAIALILPDHAVFTHLTSARLRGWWLPRIDDEPIIACSDGEAPHHDRRGVYVRRCGLPDDHREVVKGVPVASAEWTIVELAEHLCLIDLVVAIDSALRAGDTSVDAIRSTMRRGRRGVRVLRRALTLVDGRSDSPWESVLRLAHTLSAIEVEVQHQLRDDIGEIIWSLDLAIRGTRRAAEFDGGSHRTPEGQQRDMRRDRLLARHRIERYAYSARDLREDPAQVVRDADAALGRVHVPARALLWLEEFDRSTYRASGYGALLRRLRRFTRDRSPRSTRSTSGADS